MYCGYIIKLENGQKHPNADKLKIWNIFDQSVITDLNYNDNQIVVYFPSDGQLSEEYCDQMNLTKKYKPVSECTKEEIGTKQIVMKDGIECINVGGYMEPDKRNIKAIKLRGEFSDGIVLPVESLKSFGNIEKLKVGDTIDVFNGHEICRKYIPKKRRQQSDPNKVGVKRKNRKELKYEVRYPLFAEHKDTAQLAYNQGAFHEGDLIYLTRKLHGSSQRSQYALQETKHYSFWRKLFKLRPTITRDWALVSGTRRTTLRDYDGGFYGSNQFRYQHHKFFEGKLPKGMEVFYEVVGWVDDTTPIMPSVSNSKVKDKEFEKQYGKETVFTYGCEPGTSRIFVYRITMTNEDGVVFELPTEQCLIWCEKWGCEFVPILDKFFYTTWEDLNDRVSKWLDIPEPLADGKHIVEGVCVRIDNSSTFRCYKSKGIYFKILEGIVKNDAIEPDIEEYEENINDNGGD